MIDASGIEAIQPCRSIKLRCFGGRPILVWKEPWKPSWTWRIITHGMRINVNGTPCIVWHASPPSCMVAPYTEIKWDRMVKYDIEKLEKNYAVYLRYDDGNEELYVYPRKVWEKVYNNLIEPLMKGEKLKQQGAILVGPPGTGKTSMSKIIADIMSLEVIEFKPENILSKYLGESEEKTAELFHRVEMSEPSMLLMDDAEWIAKSRETLQEGSSGARSYLAMMQMILHKVEEWFKKGSKIITVITSNLGENELDKALRRGGRLGKPIYVPLPDVEAVAKVLEHEGVEPSEARKWAIKIVNAGLPMSDAVLLARDIVKGVEPEIEPQHGLGYRRAIIPSLGRYASNFLIHLDKIYNISGTIKYKTKLTGSKIALHFVLPEPVAIAVAATSLSILAEAAVVILTDPRYIDEVISAARAIDGFIIVPSETIDDNVQRIVYRQAERIVFAGSKRAPHTYAAPISLAGSGLRSGASIVSTIDVKKGLIQLVADFYNIKYDEKELQRMAMLNPDELLESLAIASVYGERISDVEKIIYMHRR